ncbi:MAG: ABC transporter ATP-binding protein [Gemmataceae bacterium]
MTILEARHITKTYRRGSAAEIQAIHDVSLTVPAGSFTTLTGPSGSGKSTLLALLGCMERPTEGQIFFAGECMQECSDAEMARMRRRIGFVFQDFALIPRLTAWENVAVPLIPRGVARRDRYKLARLVLSQLRLEDKAAIKARELSGGEQQRVAFARSLVTKPEIVLADEPTSNLDEESAKIVVLLLEQARANGITFVVSSHDPSLANLATHKCTLNKGRVVEDSSKSLI